MSVVIKNPDEIEKMRVAGRLAAEVLEMIAPHVKAGVTTDELNQLCHDYIVNVQEAIPAPLNYHGFPKSICTSINEVVCHGIPNHKKLRDGDIINIDIPARSMVLEVADSVLAARRAAVSARGWKPVDRQREVSFALRAYAMFATSADKGAVRDRTLLGE